MELVPFSEKKRQKYSLYAENMQKGNFFLIFLQKYLHK